MNILMEMALYHVRYMEHLCKKMWVWKQFILVFFKDFIYLFTERQEGKEKEKDRNIGVWLSLACTLPGTWPAT